jgi:hypothetical protein
MVAPPKLAPKILRRQTFASRLAPGVILRRQNCAALILRQDGILPFGTRYSRDGKLPKSLLP